ncbi:hypothetical protein [Actinomadura sp. DC4]|uniref:hypothetical protein n=1 Tax=Actinomadura sp. DC4 TaxID=3055069 RepID=UPI0025B20A8A|nr:hypothetical protein [Actinomadura sp. DC4]MDN3355380.1 hypothetical protein [Actinomadura sp. DC4]
MTVTHAEDRTRGPAAGWRVSRHSTTARSPACVEATVGDLVDGVFRIAQTPTRAVPVRAPVVPEGDIVEDWKALSNLPLRRRSPALQAVDRALRRWKNGGRAAPDLLDQNERELQDVEDAIERWWEANGGRSSRSVPMNRLQEEIRERRAQVAERRRQAAPPDAHDEVSLADTQDALPAEFADWLHWSSVLGTDDPPATAPRARRAELPREQVDELTRTLFGLVREGRRSEVVELLDQVRDRPEALSGIVSMWSGSMAGFQQRMGVDFPDAPSMADGVAERVRRGRLDAALELISGIEHDTLSLVALADVYRIRHRRNLLTDVPGLADAIRVVPPAPAPAGAAGRPLNARSAAAYDIAQLERALWGIRDRPGGDVEFTVTVRPLSGRRDLGHVWVSVRLPVGVPGHAHRGRVFTVGFGAADPTAGTSVFGSSAGAVFSPDLLSVPRIEAPEQVSVRQLRRGIVFVRSAQNRPYQWMLNNCVTFAAGLRSAVLGDAGPLRGVSAVKPSSIPGNPVTPPVVTDADPDRTVEVPLTGNDARPDADVRNLAEEYAEVLIRNMRAGWPAPAVRVSEGPATGANRWTRPRRGAEATRDAFLAGVRSGLIDSGIPAARQITETRIPVDVRTDPGVGAGRVRVEFRAAPPGRLEPPERNTGLSESQRTGLLADAIEAGSLDGLAAMTAGMTPEDIEAEVARLTGRDGKPFRLAGFLLAPGTYLPGDHDPRTLAVLDTWARQTGGRGLQESLPGIAGMWLGRRAGHFAAGGRRSRAAELVDQVRNRPAALSAIVHAQVARKTGFVLDMGVRFPDVRGLSDEVRALVVRGESGAAARLVAGIEHDTLSLLALADVYLLTTRGDLFTDVPELAAAVRAVPAEAAATPAPGRPLNASPGTSYDLGQLERAAWGMADHQEADIEFRIAIEPMRQGTLLHGDSTGGLVDAGHVWLEIRLPLGRDADGRTRYGRVFSAGFAPAGDYDLTRAQESVITSPDTGHVPSASVLRTITPRDLRAVIVYVRSVQNRPYYVFSNNCVRFANELSGVVFGRRPFRGLAARIPRSPRGHQAPRPRFPASVTSSPPAHVEKVGAEGGEAVRQVRTGSAVRSFVDAYAGQLLEHLRVGLAPPPVRITVSAPPTVSPGREARAASLRQAVDLQRVFQATLNSRLGHLLPAVANQIVYGEVPIQLRSQGEPAIEMFVPAEDADRLRKVPIPAPAGRVTAEPHRRPEGPARRRPARRPAPAGDLEGSTSQRPAGAAVRFPSAGQTGPSAGLDGRRDFAGRARRDAFLGPNANAPVTVLPGIDWTESSHSLPPDPEDANAVKACVSVAVVDRATGAGR